MDTSVIKQHLIDPEVCIRCNTCESVCPQGAVTHDARNYGVDADLCNWCGECLEPCPTGAIEQYRRVPRALAYTVQAQLGWDALPPQASAADMAAALAARAAEPAGPEVA